MTGSKEAGSSGRHYGVTPGNVMKIFRALKASGQSESGFVTVSEIARRAGLHKWTVSRTIDLYMGPVVEVVQPPELAALGLQVKLVRLRDQSMTPDKIVNYLRLRKKIKS